MTKKTKKGEIATVKKLPKGWKVRKDTSTRADGTVWISNGKSFFDKKYQQKLLIVDKGAFKEAQKRKKFKQTTYTDATGRAVTGKIVSDYKDKDGMRRTVTKGYNGKYSANFNGASIHGFATKAEAEKVLKKVRPVATKLKSKTKTIDSKPVVKKTIKTAKTKIRAGEFASINTASASGHKGDIAKRKKNGKITTFTITHSPYTHGRKNIQLKENPQPNDKRKAYVVKKPKKVTDKNIGKRHPEMKIKNSTDKSIMRKLKTNAKKN